MLWLVLVACEQDAALMLMIHQRRRPSWYPYYPDSRKSNGETPVPGMDTLKVRPPGYGEDIGRREIRVVLATETYTVLSLVELKRNRVSKN